MNDAERSLLRELLHRYQMIVICTCEDESFAVRKSLQRNEGKRKVSKRNQSRVIVTEFFKTLNSYFLLDSKLLLHECHLFNYY